MGIMHIRCDRCSAAFALASELCLGLGLGLGLSVAATAYASAPADSDAGSAPQLETVVVTAQKRSENLNDVPISISVVSGDQLQKRHIETYEDLTRAVPDLSSTNGGGAGMSNIEIRGISSAAGTATVGTYLDDVSMTIPNSLDIGSTEPRFFDIDQVEVLRGPQGTLYGASSMGGTIKFSSRQPDPNHREGSVYSDLSVTQHGGFNHLEQGVLNLPIVAGVSALRLGVQYSDTSGTIDQLSPALAADGETALPQTVTQHNINSDRALVLRGSFLYAAGGLSVEPALFFQREQTSNTDLFDLATPLQTAKLVPESGSDAFFVPSLTLKDDLGFGDLTSVTSFFWRHFRTIRDGTSYNSAYLAELLAGDSDLSAQYPDVDPAPVGVRPGPALYTPTVLQGAEEFRIASKSIAESGHPYTWLAGIYLADQHSHFSDNEYVDNALDTLTSLYGTDGASILIQNLMDPVDDGGAGLTLQQAQLDVASGNRVYYNESSEDSRQASVFGEFNYVPVQRLTLTAGLRYLVARTSVDNLVGGYYNADAPSDTSNVSHAYSFTPKASVRLQIARNASVYATAVKGFRLGGANLQVPYYGCHADEVAQGVGAPPSNYNPDSLWSYEVGEKSTFFGNRMSIDAAVYYIDWSKVQQQIFLNTCGFDFTENAGKARSYGADLAIRGKLTRHLTATLNANDTQASITSAAVGSGADNGSRLIGVPLWSLSSGLLYTGALTDTIQGLATVDVAWAGPSRGSFSADDPEYKRPLYSLVNASLGATFFEKLDLAVYCKNLLDQDKVIQTIQRLDVDQGYVPRPRTVGMTLSMAF